MNSQVQPNQIDIEGYNLKRQLKSSASWFYWIAALSMINWISSALQIGYGFIIGLGITQFIDGFALALKEDATSDFSMIITIISFAATLVISGLFAGFGYFGSKRAIWAFWVGIVLYILDGLLFILVKDWLPLIFHGLALFYLFRGPGIIKKLIALEEGQPSINYFQQT
jgi:hypothetical protein